MVSALLVAAALLCWPTRSAATRFSGRTPLRLGPRSTGSSTGRSRLRWVAAAVAVFVVLGGTLLAGLAGAVAAALLCLTGRSLIVQHLSARRRRQALTDILSAVRTVSRELRAGADPVVAVQNGRAAARGDGVVVLRRLQVLMRPDHGGAAGLSRTVRGRAGHSRQVTAGAPGSPPVAPQSAALSAPEGLLDVPGPGGRKPVPPAVGAGHRLLAGWLLSSRYGVALVPLIDGLATELADVLAGDARRAGEVAGPRMSGYVMAALPAMGLLLGAGMGADPLGVLLDTTIGRVLLVVGVLLTSAGLLWSARIVSS